MNPTDLKQLLSILSHHQWDDVSLDAAVAQVQGAPDDPDLDWIEDATLAMAFRIYCIARDCGYTATSDKVDEAHEVLQEIAGPDLPPFPYDDPKIERDSFAYFRWLDAELGALEPEIGGYALARMDFGFNDDMELVVVRRSDLPALLTLADQLGLPLRREDGTEPWQA